MTSRIVLGDPCESLRFNRFGVLGIIRVLGPLDFASAARTMGSFDWKDMWNIMQLVRRAFFKGKNAASIGRAGRRARDPARKARSSVRNRFAPGTDREWSADRA